MNVPYEKEVLAIWSSDRDPETRAPTEAAKTYVAVDCGFPLNDLLACGNETFHIYYEV